MKLDFKAVLLSTWAALLIAQPARAGNYFAVSFGEAAYDTSEILDPVTFAGSNDGLDESGTSTGLTLGIGLGANLAIELGFSDYGKADGVLGRFSGRFNDFLNFSITQQASIEAAAIQVAGVGIMPFNDWFAFKVLAGIEKWNAEFLWSETYSDSDDGFDNDIVMRTDEGTDKFSGAGFMFSLPNNIDLSLVYDQHDFDTRLLDTVEIRQVKVAAGIRFN